MQSSPDPVGFNIPEESQNPRCASEHLGTWLVGIEGAAPGPTQRGLNAGNRESGKGWKRGPSVKPRLQEEDVGLTIFIKQPRRRMSEAKR